METTLNATTKGAAGAKLALVEFSDFQCPFCGQFSRDTYAELQRTFVDTGILAYVYRNFPLETLHSAAFEAAEAAECARHQDRYWEMHDRLFRRQSELNHRGFMSHATMLGLDIEPFRRCLDDETTLAKVREDQAEGRRLNVTSTPTFFVGIVDSGGRIRLSHQVKGAVPFQTFKTVLDDAASEAIEKR